MSCARAAWRSRPIASCGGHPVAAATTCQSKLRPSIAAKPRKRAVDSGSNSRRASTAAAMDTGTSRPEFASPSAAASSSSMKNGTPSLLVTTASTSSGSNVAALRHSRSMTRDCAGSSGGNEMWRTTRRARSADTSSLPGPGSSSRKVTTTKTVGRSWRREVAAKLVRAIPRGPGAVGRCGPCAPPACSRDHSGTSDPRTGRNAVSRDDGASPTRAAASRASRSGRNGTTPAVGLHRPARTVPPASRTQLANSLTRRLLPIPARPRTTSIWPPVRHAP